MRQIFRFISIPFLLFFAIGILIAQETSGIEEVPPMASTSTNPEEEVISLPIYPGCEIIAGQNSPDIQKCFHNKVRTQIHDRLMMKTYELAEIGTNRMTTVLTFVVSKEGRIINVQTESGNSSIYRRIVEEEMRQMAANFPDILPAKIANGEPINYKYRVPVTFVFMD